MENNEIREYRCCMCPQINNPTSICPTGPGKNKETTCDFVNTFIDKRGWKYKVMSGIGKVFKAKYQKPEQSGWKGMRQLGWQNSFDKAQEDLNVYAKQKGWRQQS